MMNDALANTMSVILNAENRSKTNCQINPSSKLIKKVLTIMNDQGYIGGITEIENAQGITLKIELIGALNKCGAIKPRRTVTNKNYEGVEKHFLPAKDFGFIIVSTSKGLMTHKEAKQQSLGGRLIAYFY